MLSIRVIAVSMSLALILTTAIVTITISTRTGTDAVDRVERAGNEGIDFAFSAAQNYIGVLTDQMMAEMLRGAKQYTLDYTQAQVRQVMSLATYLSLLAESPNPKNLSEPLFYDAEHLRTALIPFLHVFKASVSSGSMITTKTGVMGVISFASQNSDEMYVSTQQRDHIFMFNNGTDTHLPTGSKNTLVGIVDDRMVFKSAAVDCSVKCNLVGVDETLNYAPCPGTVQGTCPVVQYGIYDPLSQPSYTYPMRYGTNASVGMWLPAEQAADIVVTVVTVPITSSLVPHDPIYGQKVGVVGCGIELRHISKKLGEVVMPNGGRIFVVDVAERSYYPMKAVGMLIGASHGRAYKTSVNPFTSEMDARAPIFCIDSEDDLVRHTCEWIERRSGAYTSLSNETYVVEFSDVKNLTDRYFVRSTLLTDSFGLAWSLTVVVPRAGIFSEIDAAVIETDEHIRENHVATQDDVARGYNTMYGILAGLGCILIALAVALPIAFAHPMNVLMREMAAVSFMDFNNVDLTRKHSSITEIRSMQISFLRMCFNLKEYRNYLPPSILAQLMDPESASTGDQEPESEDDENDQLEASARSMSSSSQSFSEVTPAPQPKVSPLATPTATPTPATGSEVTRKRISVLVVNMTRCHALFESSDVALASLKHGAFVKIVMDTVTERLGTPDVFIGDRFLATWNTVRRRATHRTSACMAAVDLKERFAKLSRASFHDLAGQMSSSGRSYNKNAKSLSVSTISHSSSSSAMTNSAEDVPPVRSPQHQLLCIPSMKFGVTMGVASGSAVCGNMGCEGMKKYTYIGPCAALVHLLERRNRVYDTTQILVDNAVADEVTNHLSLRKIDVVVWRHHSSSASKSIVVESLDGPLKDGQKDEDTVIPVWELVGQKRSKSGDGDNEWMYELEQGTNCDPNVTFTAAVDAFFEGNVSKASEELERYYAQRCRQVAAPPPVVGDATTDRSDQQAPPVQLTNLIYGGDNNKEVAAIDDDGPMRFLQRRIMSCTTQKKNPKYSSSDDTDSSDEKCQRVNMYEVVGN
eukprot:PhM_4_TR15639/c0_g2_i2/m.64607